MSNQAVIKSIAISSTYKSAAIFGIGLAVGAAVKSYIYDDPEVSKKLVKKTKSFGTGLLSIVNKIECKHIRTATFIASAVFIAHRINLLQDTLSLWRPQIDKISKAIEHLAYVRRFWKYANIN